MGQAADRLGRVGAKLRTLPEEAVRSGNRRVRSRAIAALRVDAGPDRTLSGLGRNGRAQTVKATQRKLGNLVEGRIMAGPAKQRAPWFWMEEGTEAGPRRVRGTSRRHTGTLTTFDHPGTPAKKTWSRAVGPTLPEVRADIERLYREALRG